MQRKKTALFGLLMLALLVMLTALPVAAQEEKAEIWVPDELTMELHVKTAYNGEDMLWLFEWQAPDGGNLFHDVVVYEDGKWVRKGDRGGGIDPSGLREDRVIVMVSGGVVPGFANQACYLACHDGATNMSNELDEETIKAAMGDRWSNSDIRKYIPSSRMGSEWWNGSWDAVKSVDELADLAEAGVFLDMWHWRSARGNPIDYADDQYVLEHRSNDGSKSAFGTNWDGDLGQPTLMFNPENTGFYALNWDKLMAGEYSQEDIYYLSPDTSMPFDPEHTWQNGDVIPRRFLRVPEGSQAAITADGRLTNGVWRVELRRAMDTGNSTTDHALDVGRLYDVAFAVHANATGSRWHYVSLGQKLGIGVSGQITAVPFTGNNPNWDDIPAVTIPMFYPGEITWQWLTSDAHPGAPEMRADTRSCQSCHGEDMAAVTKLAQASVYHEIQNDSSSLNWWLTLMAGLVVLAGGTVTAMNLSHTKEN